MDVKEYLSRLTVEEKAALCAGSDFWHTAPVRDKNRDRKKNIPAVMMTDGPHGLRKQKGRKATGKSHPATCFPTAVTGACSFDRELLRLEGEAIGAEAKAQGVGMVLGPGLNIKRHPLCGRNFEYFSEDPCLSGELAAAWVSGVQSRGVGACLKHFACNSQEKSRMLSDSLVDERALREIYLAGFETAVRKTKPMAVMGAYNKINGVYACENKTLLTDILRDEWGFEGMTVTDWGAMNEIAEAIEAGLDLEMPASGGLRTKRLVEAVNRGRVSMEALDRAAGNVLRFVLAVKDNEKEPIDRDGHHELARRIARESAVLLKNDGLLPLDPAAPVALVMGSELRSQGEGSSRVNESAHTRLDEALEERGITFLRPGASLDEAMIAAHAAETVILFAGIPAEDECEGFDRKTMALPERQNLLIENVLDVNPRTVVVLTGGGAMELPWADKAGAILYLGLGGQAAAGAAVDLLFGDVSPSGRLAETWPLKAEDCPADRFFGRDGAVEYRESVFVGYRYYNTADIPVRFPFGHGLSYTSFTYTDPWVDEEVMAAGITVSNTGDRPGHEVVQLYIAPPAGHVFRPGQELRHFEKIYLNPGEGRKLVFPLMKRDFQFWNTRAHDWATEGGTYTLQFAASSRDIRAELPLTLERPAPETENYMTNTPAYYAPARGERLSVPRWQFELLLGHPIPRREDEEITVNTTLRQVQDIPLGRAVLKVARKVMGGKNPMVDAMLDETPLRAFTMGGLSLSAAEKLADMLGHARAGETYTPAGVWRRLKNRRMERKSRRAITDEELEELYAQLDELLPGEGEPAAEELPPEETEELGEPLEKKPRKKLRLPGLKRKNRE